MAETTVHIVGAGLAGLSTAVRLVERGRRVVIHEANRFAGGRCRSFHDPRLGCEIDNGNHLILSGNRSVRAYLETIGASDRLIVQPAHYSFVDLADDRRWTVAMNRGVLPWWIAVPGRRIPDTGIADYLAGIRLALAGADMTVAEALPSRRPIWERFWEPLTIAAINTTPERASAQLLWSVLRETFAWGASRSRPMLAPGGLGHALVTPALEWLDQRGVEVRFNRALRAVEVLDGRASTLRFADGDDEIAPGDRAILALPPARLRDVLPGIDPPDDDCAIVNIFFRLAHPLPEPTPPILGVLSATTQWIFHRGDVVSVTVSAADALDVDSIAGAELIPLIWQETRRALGLAPGMHYLSARVNKERRATFDQSPAGAAKRLNQRTALANLFLAGDAIDTGLPATIEGAIRSGERAAEMVI